MSSKEFYDILQAEFGSDVITALSEAGPEQIIEVNSDHIVKIGHFLVTDNRTQMDSLSLLTAVDDANGKKTKNEDGSEATSGATLSVIYHLESFTLKHLCVLRVTVPKENPIVSSVVAVWKSADWHEREAFDLIGVQFDGHPDLRRILMPYDWEFGYPLRKDYKNPEFYQGMKVQY